MHLSQRVRGCCNASTRKKDYKPITGDDACRRWLHWGLISVTFLLLIPSARAQNSPAYVPPRSPYATQPSPQETAGEFFVQADSGVVSHPGVRMQKPVSSYYPPSEVFEKIIPAAYEASEQDAAAQRVNASGNAAPFPEKASSRTRIVSPTEETEVEAERGTESAANVAVSTSYKPLPLARPAGRESFRTASASSEERGSVSTSSPLGTTLFVLVGILVLILGGSRLLKKYSPLASSNLPPEVLEVLGRKMVDQRHTIHFVRAGNRILILGSSVDGMNTLSEITDPVEIDRICGQCRSREAESSVSRSFRQLMSREEGEKLKAESVSFAERFAWLKLAPKRSRNASQSSAYAASSGEEERAIFSWETPDSDEDAGISAGDIAELTRTLEAARRGRKHAS